MDITTLENWLWEAACSIRGPLDAPKYTDDILPLLFYKRLCDVFADEVDRLSLEFGNLARELVEGDRGLTRFYISEEHTWDQVRPSGPGLSFLPAGSNAGEWHHPHRGALPPAGPPGA